MNILLILSVVLCLSQIGTGYQCFECDGLSDSSCGTEFDDDKTPDVNCDGDCLKVRYDMNGQTFYRRNCATENGCDDVKKELNTENLPCQTCSGNYCNNGP